MKPLEALTIPEFCARYRTSRTSAYRLLAEGTLKAVKRGRRTLIAADEAERWFRSLIAYQPNTA
ncbi:MAG: helix-turn-helix domain-containing protein [Alphaproteobacteria bacterium]